MAPKCLPRMEFHSAEDEHSPTILPLTYKLKPHYSSSQSAATEEYATVLEDTTTMNETDIFNDSANTFNSSNIFANDTESLASIGLDVQFGNGTSIQGLFNETGTVTDGRKSALAPEDDVVEEAVIDPKLDGEIIECAVCVKKRSAMVSLWSVLKSVNS